MHKSFVKIRELNQAFASSIMFMGTKEMRTILMNHIENEAIKYLKNKTFFDSLNLSRHGELVEDDNVLLFYFSVKPVKQYINHYSVNALRMLECELNNYLFDYTFDSNEFKQFVCDLIKQLSEHGELKY